MKSNIIKFLVLCTLLLSAGCSSTKFTNRMVTNPQDILRGESTNSIKVREYLEEVLQNPEGRSIKVYKRNIFSPENKQDLFFYHLYYAFYKDGRFEHTLVFTATPKGSQHNGTWMLDAEADIQSYTLLKYDDNPWDQKELFGPDGQNANLIATTKNIINRLDKKYTFSIFAGMRTLPWYHHIWIELAAFPPIIGYPIVLISSINGDNCISGVEETVQWDTKTN